MELKLKDNINYACTIVKLEKFVPLVGCDNIQHTIIMGNAVIVSKDAKEGDVGLFFPIECKINADFLKVNNLYRDSNLNLAITKKGFFELNGRVRCVKLRGNKSEGFFIPMNMLTMLIGSKLYESNLTKNIGKTFDHIDDFKICEKYISPTNQKGLGQGSKHGKKPRVSKIVPDQFHFHIDTVTLKRNIHKIFPNDIIQLSVKVHGCVSEDSIIETLEYGEKTIKEIVDTKLQCHIKSFDISSKKIVYVPIDQYYLKKDDGCWFEIELENGKKLKITGNNPVWMPQLNCYRRVEDLKENDIILFD